MRFFVLVFLAASLSPASVAADGAGDDGQFFRRKGEGWFWYFDPKEDEPKPEQKPEQKAKPAEVVKKEKAPEPFSVEWLRDSMPKLLDAAINDPTKENVEAYLYAQRVAMDKSQRYAEMTQRVVAADPFLDENNRVPIAGYAKPFFLRNAQSLMTDALKHVSTVGGLWVFFDSKCTFCRPQVNTVQEMAKTYGFNVRYISMDGKGLPNLSDFSQDKGHAKLLNLRLTPTTVLVVPPNNYYIVSQGLMAQNQLAERILLAAETNNLLPSEMAAKLRVYDRGVLSNEDMKDGASNDPKAWVKYLKGRLEGRY